MKIVQKLFLGGIITKKAKKNFGIGIEIRGIGIEIEELELKSSLVLTNPRYQSFFPPLQKNHLRGTPAQNFF